MFRYPTLVLAAALGAATLALAQTPQPDAGFFRPKPGDDPSLSRTLPPEAYPQQSGPPSAAPAPAPAAPATTTTATTVGPQVSAAIESQNALERQMDRSEDAARDAREAEARAPPRINGAFTGETDERSR